MSPLATAGLGAGLDLLGQGINAFSQGTQNRANRRFALKMYEVQRKDALADWSMQNYYNSPEQQMLRLKNAGLNPHLIYGNRGQSDAGAVRSTPMDVPKGEAPRIDLGGVGSKFMGFYDLAVKQAQAENLKTQNAVLEADKALKEAQEMQTRLQGLKTIQDTKTGEFDLSQKIRLSDLLYEQAKANVERSLAETKRIGVDTQVTLNRDEREAAMNAANLKTAAENILNMRSQRSLNENQRQEIQHRIINLGKDERLKELDIILKAKGIQPGDPWYMRVVSQILGGVSAGQVIDEIKKVDVKKTGVEAMRQLFPSRAE